jgi:hypothetical protein
MRKFLGVVTLCLAAWASPVAAGMLNQGAQTGGTPTCQVAEVNPVTGHTECIKPLGARVDALPPSEVPPCPENGNSDRTSRYQSNCRSHAP